MTDEEKAEEYIMREDVVTENDRVPVDNGYGWQTVSFEDEVKKAYLDGLAEGKPKWHDLRKEPDDLPKEDCAEVMFVTKFNDETLTGKYKNGGGETQPIFDTFGIAFYDYTDVIAWCELPKFEV